MTVVVIASELSSASGRGLQVSSVAQDDHRTFSANSPSFPSMM
jgi:hypothetical protein